MDSLLPQPVANCLFQEADARNRPHLEAAVPLFFHQVGKDRYCQKGLGSFLLKLGDQNRKHEVMVDLTDSARMQSPRTLYSHTLKPLVHGSSFYFLFFLRVLLNKATARCDQATAADNPAGVGSR